MVYISHRMFFYVNSEFLNYRMHCMRFIFMIELNDHYKLVPLSHFCKTHCFKKEDNEEWFIFSMTHLLPYHLTTID